MESMINLDGAKLLFPTSFGYFDPHILKMAEKYPNVMFLHCGGLYTEGKHPKNVGSYFGYIDEAEYVSGIVAGLTTKTNKLGFVAAKPIPQVLRNINAFTLGARSVNPKVTLSVIFTGDWSLPVKEAEAANSLIDQGADVLTGHVDLAQGDHGDRRTAQRLQHRLPRQPGRRSRPRATSPAPSGTGRPSTRATSSTVQNRQADRAPGARRLQRGLHQDVGLRPGSRPRTAKTKADEAKAALTAGSLAIFKGPLKDNGGKEVIGAGTRARPDATSSSRK